MNLSLSCQQLKRLPPIWGWSELTELDLSGNQLESLPDFFDAFPNLEVLRLAGNRFRTFPKEILRCRRLRVLDLSGNPLQEIPPSIEELKALRVLKLRGASPLLPFELASLPLDKVVLRRGGITIRRIVIKDLFPKGVPSLQDKAMAALLASGAELELPPVISRNYEGRIHLCHQCSIKVLDTLAIPGLKHTRLTEKVSCWTVARFCSHECVAGSLDPEKND